METTYDRFEELDFQDLRNLEMIERRSRLIHTQRINDLDELDDTDFRTRYRLNKSTVEYLVQRISENLLSKTTKNQALTPTEKILTALHFFITGNQQINIGDSSKISQPSASRAISEVARSLAELRLQYIYLPQSETERQEISASFYNLCRFPAVYGALDCTQIELQNPRSNLTETFRCRKGFFSLNVQTLSDPDLLLRNIVVRWPGSTDDSTIFDNSYLRTHLETEVPHSYHILGDTEYPLRSYLMTPILNPSSDQQRRYNSAHALGRNVIERQYSVWKRRFSCISLPLRCSLHNAQTIIVATAVLHNIAIRLGDRYESIEIPHDNDVLNLTQETAAGVVKRNTIINSFFN